MSKKRGGMVPSGAAPDTGDTAMEDERDAVRPITRSTASPAYDAHGAPGAHLKFVVQEGIEAVQERW